MLTLKSHARTTSLCLAAMLAVTSTSRLAHAAPEATAARPEHHAAKHRRLRVHVDSELLGGAWVRRTNPGPAEGRASVSFGGGLGRPSLLDDGSALVARPVFGLGLGYLFEGTRALVGAKGSLTLDAYGIDDATRMVAFGGRVVPYVQWIFRPGDTVRPYVEARAGVGALRTVRHDPLMGRSASRVFYPLVGAGAGVHLFPRDWFSLDVGLNLDYAAPLLRTDDDAGTSAWAKRADVLGFGALLGASTWF